MQKLKTNPSRLELLGAVKLYENWYAKCFEDSGFVDTLYWNGQNLYSEEMANTGESSLVWSEEYGRYGYINVNWYENDTIEVEMYDECDNYIRTEAIN